jgi:hypothetical protein
MGIIGALYGRGGCGSQRKITSGGRRIPPFKKRRVGHPAALTRDVNAALVMDSSAPCRGFACDDDILAVADRGLPELLARRPRECAN